MKLDLSRNMVKALIEAVRLSEQVKPSQDAKRRAFRKYGFLGGPRDPLLTAIFYGVMKRQGILDNAIRDLLGVDPYILDPWLRAGLRVLLEIWLYRDPNRRTLRNLRNHAAALLSSKTHPYTGIFYVRLYDKIISTKYRYRPKTRREILEQKYLLPAWYVRRIQSLLGEKEADELLKAMGKQLPLSIRVNRLKARVEEVIRELSGEVKGIQRSRIMPYVLRFKGPYNFEKSRLFREGKIIVQEEAAAIAPILLDPRPGMHVADLAAAPGGKTELIGELMENKGLIDAFDISGERVERMRRLLEKAGISNVRIHVEDARRAPEILGENTVDRILLDAPCSSDGTIMKNPDLRWRLREEKIGELASLQYELLDAAWRILKPGGRLLYCTCSLLREEDEEVVSRFLRNHGDAELVPLKRPYSPGFLEGTMRAWPHMHHTIGFFYALIEKKGEKR